MLTLEWSGAIGCPAAAAAAAWCGPRWLNGCGGGGGCGGGCGEVPLVAAEAAAAAAAAAAAKGECMRLPGGDRSMASTLPLSEIIFSS